MQTKTKPVLERGSRLHPGRSLWLWKAGPCRFLGKNVPCGLPARPRGTISSGTLALWLWYPLAAD